MVWFHLNIGYFQIRTCFTKNIKTSQIIDFLRTSLILISLFVFEYNFENFISLDVNLKFEGFIVRRINRIAF